MDKSYYRLAQRFQPDSRIIFVDLGASLYDSGAGGDNGASLHWVWDTYSRLAARIRPFDRILAWEAHDKGTSGIVSLQISSQRSPISTFPLIRSLAPK